MQGRIIIWSALALAGCSVPVPDWYVDGYVEDANEVGDEVVEEFTKTTLAGLEGSVLYPDEMPPEEEAAEEAPLEVPISDPGAESATDAEPQQIMMIDLATALSLAVNGNPRFLTDKENLFLDGLSLDLTRFAYDPQLAATVDYLWSDAEDASTNTSTGGNASVSQIIPTGGSISLASSLSYDRFRSDRFRDQYNTSVGVNLNQPLLRGAGYDLYSEALTQGERNMIYAVRDFELSRQDLSIDVALEFFALVGRFRQLKNDEQNLTDATLDRRKAEALLEVDRGDENNVILAKRNEIDVTNRYIEAKTDYETQLDSFKITLGLSASAVIEITEQNPPYDPINIDPDSAVEVQLHNNFEVLTANDVLEDRERTTELAKNGLLPDFNLNSSLGFSGSDTTLSDASPDRWASSAGVSFRFPIQQKAERNAYRRALISLDQARRNHEVFLDSRENQIRGAIRDLKRLEQQIELDQQQITQQARAVRLTEFRIESGELTNRDLNDARQSELDARNSLITNQVTHFIGRLRLLKDLGILFIDDNGMWK